MEKCKALALDWVNAADSRVPQIGTTGTVLHCSINYLVAQEAIERPMMQIDTFESHGPVGGHCRLCCVEELHPALTNPPILPVHVHPHPPPWHSSRQDSLIQGL